MIIENDTQLEKLKESGRIVRDVLAAMGAAVRPGVTSLELDELAGKMLSERGARSAPIVAYEFPGHTCISVGDAVAHGIPNNTPMVEGQLVNIDVSAEKDGVFADNGTSFAVGNVSPTAQKLLAVTKAAQHKGMFAARAGAPVNAVGKVITEDANKHGFNIVAGLHGHGVGNWIHESPDVPSQFFPNYRDKLVEGQVIAIEPFFATQSSGYFEDDDGWTLRLDNGGIGAQFEHTIVVTKGNPIIVTA